MPYRAASYHMHNSRRIRKYLPVDTTRTLIHAFILGRVDYCDRDGGAGGAGGGGEFSPPLFQRKFFHSREIKSTTYSRTMSKNTVKAI